MGKKDRRYSWKKWENKGDPHLMNRVQWNSSELSGIRKVFDDDWFGYGKVNKELEKKLTDYTGLPYFNLTNSGSSAILTGIKALIHEGRIKRGDLVIHPVTTFPTSISSAIDYGLIPVFVETKPATYVIDEEEVKKAIEKYPNIKGLIFPHLLGNIPNMDKIKSYLEDRFLIEDCCDTLGGYFNGKHVGSFGDFAAFSFYGSHHITAGGVGGAIGTNDERKWQLCKSVIFWGHDFDVHDGKNSRVDFMNRYRCQTIGSDFQMSGVQAGFALGQIGKLDNFVKRRAKQFKEMDSMFKKYWFFNLPESDPMASPSWFCYPLSVKNSAPFTREDFVDYLSKNNVEIRPIMCGNILRQEAFKNIERITLNNEKFPEGDFIEEKGLFIPCWGMPNNQKKDYYEILNGFLSSYGDYDITDLLAESDKSL